MTTLVNPFEEVVVFGKALPLDPVSSTRLRALVPTGKHIGHGNALTHVHNSGGKGGKATRLQRYTTTPRGQRQGPFSKSVADGLKMVAAQAKPSRVPVAAPTPLRVRVARGKLSQVSNGSKTGTRLS